MRVEPDDYEREYLERLRQKFENQVMVSRLNSELTQRLKGTPTGFFDKNGKPICIGDELVQINEETGERKPYSRFSYVAVMICAKRGVGGSSKWYPIADFNEQGGFDNSRVVVERKS